MPTKNINERYLLWYYTNWSEMFVVGYSSCEQEVN